MFYFFFIILCGCLVHTKTKNVVIWNNNSDLNVSPSCWPLQGGTILTLNRTESVNASVLKEFKSEFCNSSADDSGDECKTRFVNSGVCENSQFNCTIEGVNIVGSNIDQLECSEKENRILLNVTNYYCGNTREIYLNNNSVTNLHIEKWRKNNAIILFNVSHCSSYQWKRDPNAGLVVSSFSQSVVMKMDNTVISGTDLVYYEKPRLGKKTDIKVLESTDKTDDTLFVLNIKFGINIHLFKSICIPSDGIDLLGQKKEICKNCKQDRTRNERWICERSFSRGRGQKQKQFQNLLSGNVEISLPIEFCKWPKFTPIKTNDSIVSMNQPYTIEGTDLDCSNIEIRIGLENLTKICKFKKLTNKVITCITPEFNETIEEYIIGNNLTQRMTGDNLFLLDVTYALLDIPVLEWKLIGYINYKMSKFEPNNNAHLIMILPPIAILLVVLIFLLVFIVRRYKRFKEESSHVQKSLEIQLETQEANYAKLQKDAFLEYHSMGNSIPNLGFFKPEIVQPMKQYLSNILFPNPKFENPLQGGLLVHPDDEPVYKSTLENFEELLQNESFLSAITNSWDSSSSISSQEKSYLASLLILYYFPKPNLCLGVMCHLIKDVIKIYVKRKSQRILFRSNEFITEKFVSNWLTICLYPELKGTSFGESLYFLYRSIKSKVGQGPVDAATHQAKFALSIDYLLDRNEKYTPVPIRVTHYLVMGCESKEFIVNFLPCDTVTQMKQKILDQAMIEDEEIDPNILLTDPDYLVLYLHSGNASLILKDKDHTSVELQNGYAKLNTMKHYNIKESVKLTLSTLNTVDSAPECDRNDHSMSPLLPSLNSLTMPASEHWVHLIQPEFSETSPTKSSSPLSPNSQNSQAAVPGVKEAFYLTLLSTKQVLLPFIDKLFNFIMPQKEKDFRSSVIGCPLPESLCYLFRLFDILASMEGVTDDKAVQLWKSNIYILRFWVNLIKNPNFIFICDKSVAVDASLSTVSSVLMEASTSDATRTVNENSPTNKILFHNDIKDRYIPMWLNFLETVQCNPHDFTKKVCGIMESITSSEGLKGDHLNTVLKILLKYVRKQGPQILSRLGDDPYILKLYEDIL